MGQLPCEERTNALGLVGWQERWRKRGRFAGLPGTSRCSEGAAPPALGIPKNLVSFSWADTAQLWGTRLIRTLLLVFLAPKLPLEVIVREGYFPSQAGTLVLMSYISRVYFCSWICFPTTSVCAHTGGGKSIWHFNRSPSPASYTAPACFIQYNWWKVIKQLVVEAFSIFSGTKTVWS